MEHILPLLPRDGSFSVTPRNTLGLLRKAARNWNLDPKDILFAVAFDHAAQSETFFRALRDLSAAGPDLPSSVALLCALANQQRSHAHISKRTGVHTARSGIARKDVELAVASSRKTDPPDNPQEVKEPP
ncbi:hypothetical protein ColLi_12193 [Colletotrichum liriopes]|uniref:Uncharacterized protein n=1 Tax=Colletotrichum liriopes TaxID=708192 RepID=A0AA37GZ55_9PEZI|nr:hypothetical protein ColLi_12193 [Colletotrichum liriopes]